MYYFEEYLYAHIDLFLRQSEGQCESELDELHVQ